MGICKERDVVWTCVWLLRVIPSRWEQITERNHSSRTSAPKDGRRQDRYLNRPALYAQPIKGIL